MREVISTEERASPEMGEETRTEILAVMEFVVLRASPEVRGEEPLEGKMRKDCSVRVMVSFVGHHEAERENESRILLDPRNWR